MDRDQHYLLNHLDKPTRFLFLTVDEFLAIAVPLFSGIVVGWGTSGFLGSLAGYSALRILKRRFKGGTIRQAMYWYLPTSRKQMKVYIPSYVREYIS